MKTICGLIAVSVVTLFLGTLAGCGSSDSSTSSGYSVEYLSASSSAVEGKSTYKIKVTNRSDGKPAVGRTVSLMPIMYMTSMNHSTPYEALIDNGDGTYSGTIYFLMASTMADGSSMGRWELKFTIENEATVFNPTVAMAMGSTARTTLKGVNDKIRSMSGGMTSSSRTYYLFNDGSAGSTVKLFIATADDSMMMKFPAVSVGSTLHDMNNAAVPVSSMKVEVSTDKASWSSATDNGNGHWSAAGLIGLGATGHAYVRVTVNGEQKTTDGTALSASNGYADFTVSTSGGM